MTSGAPWSVKGIDPKAREIAKDLARRSGMTLGEWLNQVILEDGPLSEPPPAYSPSSQRGPAPYGRVEAPQHPSDEVYRVTEALDRLSARIEAAEHRSTLAISGIDQSVSGLVSRLTGAEREQTAVAARFEGAFDDMRTEQTRVIERLRRIEQEAAGPRSVEALRAMEAALGKVATHLYEGEARTRETLDGLRLDLTAVSARVDAGPTGTAELVDGVVARIAERLETAEARTTAAMRALESSFAHLDDRLGAAEARLGGRSSDVGLEQLAASLSARVDAVRSEMAEKIRATSEGRFDRVELALQEMSGHVQAAERRSAGAIERMGHEVLRMADVLNRKVQDSEHRSADAIEQVGGEVARIANAMEHRLDRIDGAGAQALEKLGAEIARITERLSERIADAERRSAQAIDDVGEQMSRFGERFQDRQERASSELSERIRQSEERTARLLDDARERINQRLVENQKASIPAAPPPPSYFDPAVAPFGQIDLSAAADLAPRLGAPLATSGFEAEATDFDIAPSFDETSAFDAADPFLTSASFDVPVFEEVNIDASPEPVAAQDAAVAAADARAFSRAALADPPAVAIETVARTVDADAPPTAQTAAPTSTRALIEQARASARAASDESQGRGRVQAAAAASGHALFSGFGVGGKKQAKRRPGSSLTAALLLSGAAAAVGVALAGYEIINENPHGRLPSRVVDALGGQSSPHSGRPLAGETAQPLAAMALTPKPIGPAATATLPPVDVQTAPAEGAAELYTDGVQKMDAHDPAGLDAVRKAANLNYAPAEFFLAKLYETGEQGLKKDPFEARRWTERAADAGDRKAMHNLALYYFEGTGGGKNTTIAAEWFRRAAEAGLVDSQYNLGRLYEEGFGVAQNPAEAYKWYLIAGASGDGESRASAKRLKPQLSPESEAAAERAAQSFQAQAARSTAAAPTGGVAAAQRALTHLGYYRGPADGMSSPALKFAIAAFQRDKGLAVTGELDASVAPLLDAAAR